MRAYTVTIHQAFPEFVSEEVVVKARDLVEAVMLSTDVLNEVKEGLLRAGVKEKELVNIRVTAVEEQETVMNPDGPIDPEKVQELVEVIKIGIDD